jgi:hypothetical protein
MLRPRLPRLLATWLALALIPAVPAAAPKNLLENPGFEAPLEGHDWMPAAWDTSVSGLQTVFFGRDTFLVRSGDWAAGVASAGSLIPLAHNWTQRVKVGPEAWGKDLVFSVWTRNNGVDGRAYILLQAYRDTISKMALEWGVDRDVAMDRLGYARVDDPLIDLGWARQVFMEHTTDWVRREVRVFCPPSINMVYVRVGLSGTGQVLVDDASLTLEKARPAKAPEKGVNLFANQSFEQPLVGWEVSVPPYDGMRIERDSTVAHSGRFSVRGQSGTGYFVETRAGVGQVFCNRALAGSRVRLSGFVKSDSLRGVAMCMLFAHTMRGLVQVPPPETWNGTMDWTPTKLEMDLPADTYAVWAWFNWIAPNPGRVWFDDLRFEVTGKAKDPRQLPVRAPGR